MGRQGHQHGAAMKLGDRKLDLVRGWADGFALICMTPIAVAVCLVPVALIGFAAGWLVALITGVEAMQRVVFWGVVQIGSVIVAPMALGLLAADQMRKR